tara:strand:- start:1211 stop:1576 length:366 start_codon:yes stop_codon:yes gene_type:complete
MISDDLNEYRKVAQKHFLIRARQRGLAILDERVMLWLNKAISAGNPPPFMECVRRLSKIKHLWKLTYREKDFYLIYNYQIKSFITVLPQKMVDRHKPSNFFKMKASFKQINQKHSISELED